MYPVIQKERETFDGNMAGRRISNLGCPEHDSDAATRQTVSQLTQGVLNTAIGLFLRRDGMHLIESRCFFRDGSKRPTRDLSVGNHRLTQLAPVMGPWNAANRKYIDDLIRSANPAPGRRVRRTTSS